MRKSKKRSHSALGNPVKYTVSVKQLKYEGFRIVFEFSKSFLPFRHKLIFGVLLALPLSTLNFAVMLLN